MNDAWDRLMTLKLHPEFADTPGYELETLYAADEPAAWFLLLTEQPQLAPPREWWSALRKRNDLPWARLLAARPQFGEYCHWESVSRLELVKLSFLAPELFARQFPEGRRHDLYGFLTPWELARLLSDVPQAAEELDMDDIAAKLMPDLWLSILAFQPQLERFFDWSTVEKKPSLYWDELLRHQAQFADHCDFAQLASWQVRRILVKQPQLASRCDWSKLAFADRKKLEAKGIRP